MKPEIDSGDERQHNLVATHCDRWSISSGFLDDDDASNYTHIFKNTRHDGQGRGLNANLNGNNLVPRFGHLDLDHGGGGYTHIFNNTRHDGQQGELNASIQSNNIAPRFGYWEDHRCCYTHIFNSMRHEEQGELVDSIQRNNITPRFGYWNFDHRFGDMHIMSNNNSRRSDAQNGNNLDPRRNPNNNNTRLRGEGARKETKTPTTNHRKSPMKNRNPSKTQQVSCFSWIKRGWSLIF